MYMNRIVLNKISTQKLVYYQTPTWTEVSHMTVADRGFFVSKPISPIILPEVRKSIRFDLTSILDVEPLALSL